MLNRLFRMGWVAAAGAGMVVGCQSGPGPQYPPGPLLAERPPVEGKAGSAAPVQVADVEPQAPALPSTALASSTPMHRDPAAYLGLPVGSVRPSAPIAAAAPAPAFPAAPAVTAAPVNPFRTAAREPGPVVATPAVRSSAKISESDANINGNRLFGHDDNYSWLQGVLEKHYHGHYYLRFCDPSEEDRWGGKVCLDQDPTLSQYHDGDVIRVEGSIVNEPDTKRHEGWKQYPRYHVRTTKRIQ